MKNKPDILTIVIALVIIALAVKGLVLLFGG
jgi:hypothetical protein